MLSFGTKSSMDEVIELVTEYDPRNHSVWSTYAGFCLANGEDLAVEGNENGATVYDIKSGLHANTSNMDANNFVEVDLTTLDAAVPENYTITNYCGKLQ